MKFDGIIAFCCVVLVIVGVIVGINLDIQKSNVDLLNSLFGALSDLATLFAGVVALYGLNMWRNQIKYKIVYDNAVQFEASMTLFLMYSSGEDEYLGRKELDGNAEKLNASFFLLKQRDFMFKETDELYNAYIECMRYSRETGDLKVPKQLHSKCFDKLNAFSKKLSETI